MVMLAKHRSQPRHYMITLLCKRCGSNNLSKNGHTPIGQQKYHCQQCGFYGTLDTKEQERAAKRPLVEALHLERLSQRAMARITGMSRSTIIQLLKKVLHPIAATIIPSSERPIVELDELWSFVRSKLNRVWIW